MASDMQTHGFPPGYFIVRSVATNRALDVHGDDIEDGTEIILWSEKETSLVESVYYLPSYLYILHYPLIQPVETRMLTTKSVFPPGVGAMPS